MSIEIQVNEDIREYESKTFINFTTREFWSLVTFGIIELPLFLLTRNFLGQAVILPIGITGIPIILYGFWKPYGFYFEEYARVKINNSLQLRERGYKNNNCIREIEKICHQYELHEKRVKKRKK